MLLMGRARVLAGRADSSSPECHRSTLHMRGEQKHEERLLLHVWSRFDASYGMAFSHQDLAALF